MWQSKSRQEELRQEEIKQTLLTETALVGSIARNLAAVRVGKNAPEEVIEDLVALRERFQVSPDALAQALIAHEYILGTDEGLDADLGGGSLVPALVKV